MPIFDPNIFDSNIFDTVRDVSVSDTIGLSDSVTFTREINESITDGLGIGDTSERGFRGEISDGIGLSDSVTFEVLEVFNVSITDGLGLGDGTSGFQEFVSAARKGATWYELLTQTNIPRVYDATLTKVIEHRLRRRVGGGWQEIYAYLPTPTGLSVTYVDDNNQDLSWNHNNHKGETAIERNVDGGVFSEIDTVARDIGIYTDTTTLQGHAYSYRLKARSIETTASSDYSSVVTVRTTPDPPGDFLAIPVDNDTIDLSWNLPSSIEAVEEYGLYRNTTNSFPGDTGKIDTIFDETQTQYQDNGLNGGTTYYYWIESCNSDAGCSSTVTDSTTTDPDPAAAPSNLSTSVFCSVRVDLSWIDNATTNNGYVVQRREQGTSTWTTIASGLAAGATSYQDTNPLTNTTSEYRVGATKAGADTSYSNVASATVPATDPIVTNLVVRDESSQTELVAGVDFDTGCDCESVDIYYQWEDDPSESFLETKNVSINGSFSSTTVSRSHSGSEPFGITFRIVPWSKDASSGVQGTDKSVTDTVVLGGGEN